jgi:hypothetical protein
MEMNEYQALIMTLLAMEDKTEALNCLLNMEAEMIFEALGESETGLRQWLLRYDVVQEVLRAFAIPVAFELPIDPAIERGQEVGPSNDGFATNDNDISTGIQI